MPDEGYLYIQELLEWVNQPPPPQGRDTHAISFELLTLPPNGRPYGHSGLMFFRPQGTGHGPGGSPSGLTGVGQLTYYSGLPSQRPPLWVRVDVIVRVTPPEIYAPLFFFNGGLGLPEIPVRTVETDLRAELSQPFWDITLTNPYEPEKWFLRNLHKTTALWGLGRPTQ